MNILVFGGGAIGCHISYCMRKAGHTTYLVSRGEHYEKMKRSGMHMRIFDNENLIEEQIVEDGRGINIVDDLSKITVDGFEFDYIFITVKLSDYNEENLSKLQPFMGEDTAVIPPCTKMPFWWFYNLDSDSKFNDVDFDVNIASYFKRENIIMMTMWLSAVLEKPGQVTIKHTQRGYPLGAVYPKMDEKANKLRDVFEKTCMSPHVDDIRSEIFIKSINSLAFNTAALNKEFDNFQLSQDAESKEAIKKIMEEGEEILKVMGIPIIQNIDDRIRQTLSSTKHTMSMLHDYRSGKTVEISYIWNGFNRVCQVLGIEMKFTESLVNKILLKISSN